MCGSMMSNESAVCSQPSYTSEYTAYVQEPTHIARSRVHSRPSFFCPSSLRKVWSLSCISLLYVYVQELLQRQVQCRAIATDSSCPAEVDSYHTLCPLKTVKTGDQETRHIFGHPSTCYRATSSKDGLFYCLWRLHGEYLVTMCVSGNVCVGVRLTTHKSVQQFEKWRKVEHANLVALREMFTTKAFGDNCECV